MKDTKAGLGDDQGTRVGKPTGAGAEAAEGLHGADGDRQSSDRTALDGKSTGRGGESGADRAGSEPTTSHPVERSSGYGGGGPNGGAKGA